MHDPLRLRRYLKKIAKVPINKMSAMPIEIQAKEKAWLAKEALSGGVICWGCGSKIYGIVTTQYKDYDRRSFHSKCKPDYEDI